jgi:hypothetical protein
LCPQKQRNQIIKLKLDEVRELLLRGEIVNYIRHVGTLQVIQELINNGPHAPRGGSLQPNSGLYVYEPNDTIIMAVLNAPQRGQEVAPRLEDLAFYLVALN